MERRQFIRAIGKTLTGFALAPHLVIQEHIAMPAAAVSPDIAALYSPLSMTWVTTELVNLMVLERQRRNWHNLEFIPGASRFEPKVPRLSHIALDARSLSNETSILSPREFSQRHLAPIAHQLTEAMRGARTCGALPLPMWTLEAALVKDDATGLSIRGARDTHTIPGGHMFEYIRFDILHG